MVFFLRNLCFLIEDLLRNLCTYVYDTQLLKQGNKGIHYELKDLKR
jgi:hypothetical protein